jgi:hypothetical protein
MVGSNRKKIGKDKYSHGKSMVERRTKVKGKFFWIKDGVSGNTPSFFLHLSFPPPFVYSFCSSTSMAKTKYPWDRIVAYK